MKTLRLSAALLALTLIPLTANAGSGKASTMACSVSVTYSRNGAAALTYVRDFVVDPAAPYFEDFSTPLRSRFFSATVAEVAGTPEVSIAFDADVDVFNAIDFGTTLQVRDPSHGDTVTGNNTFFGGSTSGNVTHRTDYTLTCKRAP